MMRYQRERKRMLDQVLGPRLFEYGDKVRHKETGLSGRIVSMRVEYSVITSVTILTEDKRSIEGDSVEGVDFALLQDGRQAESSETRPTLDEAYVQKLRSIEATS